MFLRQKILPRTFSDASLTLFTVCIIPLIYYFELFVVLPHYYSKWGLGFCFHFITGTLILYNICSNYVATVLCDTSIKGRMLPTLLGPSTRFCAVCECISPPRTWHCDICNVCILKRDHHCMFTSCCIGHHNLRYFLMFVFYIFIATIYASYYNLYFVFEFANFGTWESIVKIIFPLATLFVEFTQEQMYIFFVLIVTIGGIFTGVLFYYHCDLIIRGIITHEKRNKLNEYDLGIKRNIQMALGERWYLVWVSAFITSKLPHEGIVWDTKQSLKAK